jgi:hypothetical protein
MKSFKHFAETVERRRSDDENHFIDKHVVDKKQHPVAKDDQFVSKAKKDKSRSADYKEKEDVEVNEEADTHKTKDGRTAKKGLYFYINQKKKRGEKPNPKGHPDRPDEDDFKAAEKTAKEEVEIVSEAVIDDLRKIVKTKSASTVKFANGGKTKVDMFTASAMIKVHDSLNDGNKQKFADSINKNEQMFMKMMDFAMSKVK